MRTHLKLSFFVLALLAIPVVFCPQLSAQEFQTKAKQAYLIDARTGTVLFAKNEDEQIPPASLAKIMTMEMVFNALQKGELSLEDTFKVSENAWRTGGAPSRTSTMFAALKSEIRVEDLIRGAIVHSGNDSCIILAEGMAGDEATFASHMTARAGEIGLKSSVFANSTGLPDEKARVTMRDLVTLSKHIFDTYPEYYKYYSETEFTWNKIRQLNRAPLLTAGIGVDGLKTGFTEESGYAIASSIEQNGQRLFLAMSGLATKKQRQEETRRILLWALENFKSKLLFKKGENLGTASVYGGAGEIDLIAGQDVDILLPANNTERLKARVAYKWPLAAPVKAGDEVGEVRIWVGETLSRTAPVFAKSDMEKGEFHDRAWDAFKELLLFWL
ncbi:D-alanyl-D-alanine carboxypeptidase family protein [Lentilitoribacter sp. Alg239-R112]|jgi:D-alanyl-D-alanine carboxypeptidase (penicillin-binding protein 5/6)|uniref:D-alanyl-D-alanine carboxypeptidase family protein n=1 Tax=Lentilitoribacter sp. Alg239-R112 TaxID=2305987 RepID=UPI0013A6C5DF|nr:D-alanyl-D-alanine carboxypeptidase family protein [Lentilitoribacter sp. Alg239-R112]